MDVVPLPATAPPVEEAELVVRIPAGVKNPASKVSGAAREAVASRPWLRLLPLTDRVLRERVQLLDRKSVV